MVLAPPAQKDTIQQLPDARKNSAGVQLFGFTQRGPLLPAWGTRERERVLRNLYRHDYNWMVQGAFSGIMSIIGSTPWEIKGPEDLSASETKYWKTAYKAQNAGKEPETNRPDIEYYQELLRQADFGRGWTSFCKKGVDYLRNDGGWFWELIAPGDPLSAPSGPITGIAHLDSLRSIPTGDPEYPVIYYDRFNKYHLLHRSRVVQLVDMPDGDEYHPGYGLCALSRAVAISMREILMGRYIEGKLDDKPPPGMVVAKGMIESEREKALALYRQDQSTDERPPWGKQLWFFAPDPALDISLDVQSFTEAPEKFDFKQYTEIDVDALALAIGVDRQDLWQLTGGNMGSGTQSEVLHQKSRGKTIGGLRTEMERVVNDFLPDEYSFHFKYQDAQQDLEQAKVAHEWASVSKLLVGTLDANEQRALLADKVEAIQEAITDENGKIREVDDSDVQPETTTTDTTGAAQAQDANATAGGKPDVSGQGGLPDAGGTRKSLRERSRLDADLGRFGDADTSTKAIQSTLIDFEDAFADAIKGRLDGDLSGLRFGIIARDLLRIGGLKALRDGLEDGGVPQFDEDGAPVSLDPDDEAAFYIWLAEQSAYVTDFGRTLTKGADVDPEYRAAMWGNKSILAMYDVGRLSANRNGMYEWVLGKTEEHCKDCKRLNGQVHRFKGWNKSGWMPQADKLSCHGFNCDCSLVNTTDRARGRF